jgi:hypothetical protein
MRRTSGYRDMLAITAYAADDIKALSELRVPGLLHNLVSDGSGICLRSWDRTLDTKEQQNCLSGLSTSGCGVLLLYGNRGIYRMHRLRQTQCLLLSPVASLGLYSFCLLGCRTRKKCAGYIALQHLGSKFQPPAATESVMLFGGVPFFAYRDEPTCRITAAK